MENKDLIIIALAVLVVYLYWQQTQQNNQPALIQPNNQELQELRNQVQHYQTLYQKRVQKDLEADQTAQIQQLAEEFQSYKTTVESEKTELVSQNEEQKQLFQQKIKDLEKQLLDVARSKIKGKKDAEKLLNDLERNWNADKEEKAKTIANLNQSYEKLNQEFQQKEKVLLEEKKTIIENYEKAQDQWQKNQAVHQEQLKQINLLFDPNSARYERIDFNGLYSLLNEVKNQKKNLKTYLNEQEKNINELEKLW